MIVFIIKTYFFNKVSSYNLDQKSHILGFFCLFYEEMIRLICVILAVIIKELQLPMSNRNFLLKKSAIWFKLYIQKSEKSGCFVFFFLLRQLSINWFKGVCLTWKNLGWNTFSISRLYYGNLQETYPQVNNWEGKKDKRSCQLLINIKIYLRTLLITQI